MPADRKIQKLQGLRSFVSVVRRGSVKDAADEQHYDASSICSHVRALEKRLHVSLLRRNGAAGRSALTAEGEALAPPAERAVDAVNDVESKAAEIADGRS